MARPGRWPGRRPRRGVLLPRPLPRWLADRAPGGRGPTSVAGATLALHGESSVIPWDSRITADTDERVAVEFSTSLTRYPFTIVRELALGAGDSTLAVTETVRNDGEVTVPYSWLQHIALGEPLVDPDAHLDVPCETVLVDPDQTTDTARLPQARPTTGRSVRRPTARSTCVRSHRGRSASTTWWRSPTSGRGGTLSRTPR
ncbi:DUF4432 family protein [Halomicroarcula sp. GCM10025710]